MGGREILIPDRLETVGKASPLLEKYPGAGLQLVRKNRAGDDVRVGVRRPCFHQCHRPPAVDDGVIVSESDGVIVSESDHVTSGSPQGPVPGHIQPCDRLQQVPDADHGGDGTVRLIVGRGVVYDDDLMVHSPQMPDRLSDADQTSL